MRVVIDRRKDKGFGHVITLQVLLFTLHILSKILKLKEIPHPTHIPVCMNSKTSAICFSLHLALVFITDNACVYCALRTGFGNTLINQSNLSL
jgi:hypothetical protein